MDENNTRRKAYFDRILRKLELDGIYMPTTDIKPFLENIQKKAKKDLNLMLERKHILCTSMSDYLTSFENYQGTNTITITDDAISEMLKAINYLMANGSVLSRAELAVVMIVQLIKIHCVSMRSRDFTNSDKNFVAIIDSDSYWKGIGTESAHKYRSFKFFPRVY